MTLSERVQSQVLSFGRRRSGAQSLDEADAQAYRVPNVKGISSAAFALMVIAVSVVYWSGNHNPDWRAYRILFDSGGWLLKQQRDPGFHAIILAFKTVSTSFDLFRLVVGLYFVAFSAWFLWFAGLQSGSPSDLYFVSYLGILPLAMITFTTEIREGLAVTLVLFALVTLQHPPHPLRAGPWLIALSVALLVAASTIHSGAVIFLAAMLISIGVGAVSRFLGMHLGIALIGAVCITVGASLAFYFAGGLDWLIATFGRAFYGKAFIATGVNAGKLGYWSINAGILSYLVVKAKSVAGKPGLSMIYSLFLRYTAYAILPLLQGLILLLILARYPGIVVSSAMRAFALVLLTTVALISFPLRKTWPLVAISLFLVVDVERILLAAGQ